VRDKCGFRLAPVADDRGLVPLPAGRARPRGAPRIGAEELLQEPRPHLVHHGPDRALGGLQVRVPGLGVLLRDPGDEAVYLLGDFLANRLRNFFFSAARAVASSAARTGRRSQIRSLTATSSAQRRTKVR